MSVELVYHPVGGQGDQVSPFALRIREILSCRKTICLAGPYLSVAYLRDWLQGRQDFRVITDVAELLRADRQQTKDVVDFLRSAGDRLHHYTALHAKVLFAGDRALIGSANFTRMGLGERTEMSVYLEGEVELIDELQGWFEQLWATSHPPLLSEVEAIVAEINTGKESFAEQEKKERRLKQLLQLSGAPVRARVPTKLTQVKPFPVLPETEQENEETRLIRRVQQLAENREFAESYFALLREALLACGLESGDPRLVVSIPKEARWPITINRRRVIGLRAWRGRVVTSFILGRDLEHDPQVIASSINISRFKPSHSETAEMAPLIVRLPWRPGYQFPEGFLESWKQTTKLQCNLGERSSYLSHHSSVAYKAIVEEGYRTSLLDRAFPKEAQRGDP